MAITEALSTDLILVRDAQSLPTSEGSGTLDDSGLTELGWRQAQLVADWLADFYHLDAIVSSSTMRSRQTAEVIAHRLHLPASIVPGLEEVPATIWDEIAVTISDPLANWWSAWQPGPDIAPSYTAFRGRVRAALEQLLGAYAGRTVALICHGGVIGTVLRSLFGGHQMAVTTEHTGLTHVVWQEGRWRLLAHNSRTHLAPLQTRQGPDGQAALQPKSPWLQDLHLRAVLDHFQAAAHAYPAEPAIPTQRELQALVAFAAPGPQSSVLDVATGPGTVALAFAPHVKQVVGVDVSPAMLERAERARLRQDLQNVRFRWGEASALPFADHSFDLVVCHDLLHYLTNPKVVLASLARVLAPGGILVLDDTVGSDDPVKRATQNAIETRRDPSFTQVYSTQETRALLSAARYCITKLQNYDAPRELEEWLSYAAADEDARREVKAMFEASLDADAAGMNIRRSRDGTLTFVQHRVRVLAEVCESPE